MVPQRVFLEEKTFRPTYLWSRSHLKLILISFILLCVTSKPKNESIGASVYASQSKNNFTKSSLKFISAGFPVPKCFSQGCPLQNTVASCTSKALLLAFSTSRTRISAFLVAFRYGGQLIRGPLTFWGKRNNNNR